MAIVKGLTTSFRREMLQGVHNITVDSVKIALYGPTASLGKSTTAYSTTDEIAGTGYAVGGQVVTGMTIADQDDVVYATFDKPQWSNTTISARAALLYNASKANRSIAVIDFRDLISTVAEIFRIDLPNANARDAIIRIP